MKKLLADKDIAGVLDKVDEKKVFYDKMREVAKKTPGGRLTRDGLREVLGYFRSGKAANIDAWKEAVPLAQKIAKKLLPAGTSRYRYRQDWNTDGQHQAFSRSNASPAESSLPKTTIHSSGSSISKPTPNASRFTPPRTIPRGMLRSPRF